MVVVTVVVVGSEQRQRLVVEEGVDGVTLVAGWLAVVVGMVADVRCW